MGRVSSSSGIWVLAKRRVSVGTARRAEAVGRSVPGSPHPLAAMLSLLRASQYWEAIWPCSLSPSPPSRHIHPQGPSLRSCSVATDLLVQGSLRCPVPSHPCCCVVSDPALPLIQP